MKLLEGLVQVPDRWIEEFYKEILLILQENIVYQSLLLLQSMNKELESETKALDFTRPNKREERIETISNLTILIDSFLDELDRYCNYNNIDLQGYSSIFDFDLSQNISKIYEPYYFKSATISPKGTELQNYNIDDASILPDITVKIDLPALSNAEYRDNIIYIGDVGGTFSKEVKKLLSSKPIQKVQEIIAKIFLAAFEHEAIHYMQDNVLPRRDIYFNIDIAAYEDSPEYYYQTELEFQPQIISAYGDFIRWRNTKEFSKTDLNTLIKEYVSKRKSFISLGVGSQKWKEAVRLFYQYVMEKDG